MFLMKVQRSTRLLQLKCSSLPHRCRLPFLVLLITPPCIISPLAQVIIILLELRMEATLMLKQDPNLYATAFSMDKLNPRLDVNVAYEPERGNSNPQFTQDLFVPPSGKRKRDDSSAQYQNGGYIPQQDGARDAMPKANLEGNAFCITFVSDRKVPRDFTCSSSNIPQVDGPMPDAYDEMLSTPNIYSYQGPAEDFNDARTPAPNEIQTSTPVAVQNDIIEDDDDDELDDLESGEDMNTQHLVLAQFDKVTRTKSRWKCNLKNGIMHINDKDILFNKALGEFDF